MSACGLCHSLVEPDNSFSLKICRHEFCHQCLHNYVRDNLKDKIERLDTYRRTHPNAKVDILHEYIRDRLKCQIKCPNEMCQKNIPDQVIRKNYMYYSANEAIKKRKKEALEELCKSDEDFENPEAFYCPVCCNFIFPRSGIMFRNCFHCFCRNCFKEIIKDAKHVGMLTCPCCNDALDDREVIKEIGEMELKDLVCKLATPKLFSCKTPDCKGLCDKNNSKSTFTCPFCFRVNCLDCEDIHERSTCDDFRQTKRYKDTQKMKETIRGSVTCRCGQFLIFGGGSGALKCPNCFRDICAFMGKLAGNKGPDSCGCTARKTCHSNCIFGCFPF